MFETGSGYFVCLCLTVERMQDLRCRSAAVAERWDGRYSSSCGHCLCIGKFVIHAVAGEMLTVVRLGSCQKIVDLVGTLEWTMKLGVMMQEYGTRRQNALLAESCPTDDRRRRAEEEDECSVKTTRLTRSENSSYSF